MVNSKLQELKALVVDDYGDTCDLVGFILDTEGIAPTCVTSVNEALEIYRSLQPDILIADLGMPVEDGFSLIRQIRALKPEEGGQVPAIALTGYTTEDVKLEVVEAGFQGFVSKPFEIDELITVVANLLELPQC